MRVYKGCSGHQASALHANTLHTNTLQTNTLQTNNLGAPVSPDLAGRFLRRVAPATLDSPLVVLMSPFSRLPVIFTSSGPGMITVMVSVFGLSVKSTRVDGPALMFELCPCSEIEDVALHFETAAGTALPVVVVAIVTSFPFVATSSNYVVVSDSHPILRVDFTAI